MIRHKALYIIILSLFFSGGCISILHAQKGLLRRADKRFDLFSYAKSAQLYVKYIQKNPTDPHALERAGDSYRLRSHYQEAEYWYRKAAENGFSAPIYQKYYASALMNTQKYDEAAVELKSYLELYPEDAQAKEMMYSCKLYHDLMQNASPYRVKIATVNTPEADFSPGFLGDKIVFASARRGREFVFGWTGRAFLDLYECAYDGTEDIGAPHLLKGEVNTRFHEAATTISPDGQTLYFTRNNFFRGHVKTDTAGTILLKTYSAKRSGSKWAKVKGMPFNSDKYSAGHPALFNEGNSMIITSDMPGGYGGTDLYVLHKEGENWSSPVNLGESINTNGSEMFPWVSPSGDLYFASDGHKGLGGLDIFQAHLEGSSATGAHNLGYPINTSFDDFAFILDEANRVGFFSSNREGGAGDDDIYTFSLKQLLKVKVVDEITGLPVPGADVTFLAGCDPMLNKETDKEGKTDFYPPDVEDFSAEIAAQGYLPLKEPLSILDFDYDNDFTHTVRVSPVKPVKGNCDPIVLSAAIPANEAGLIPEGGAKVKLYTQVKEFTLTPDNLGLLSDLYPNADYVMEIQAPGLAPKKIPFTTRGLTSGDTLIKAINIEPGKEDIGKVFYIIYYNFDKSDVRQDASLELDAMVDFMKQHPNVSVELSSHTDCRGGADYNLRLSQSRALEAYNYIISKGISRDRLAYQWFGESKPANRCTDGVLCSEEEHQFNRRTEFKLTGIK